MLVIHVLIIVTNLLYYIHNREFHTKMRELQRPLREPIYQQRTRKLVGCVYSCIRRSGCRLLGYNKTSSICHLYPANIGNTQYSEDTILFGDLIKKEEPDERQCIQNKNRIVLKKVKTSWKAAEEACRVKNMTLIDICDENKQATVVNILKTSGLERVAIGVFRDKQKWAGGGKQEIVFSDWAKGEPGPIDFFAGLSKGTGYKWKGFLPVIKFDGVLCEMR